MRLCLTIWLSCYCELFWKLELYLAIVITVLNLDTVTHIVTLYLILNFMWLNGLTYVF